MIPLNEIFEVSYGHSLELNRLIQISREDGGIPFISRKSGDNGISAYVEYIEGITPADAGLLTCALSGNGVLSTFIQETPFYSGYHIAHLKPRTKMSKSVLLFYCYCLSVNRYRYNYGRQANKTLTSLLLPALEEIPEFVKNVDAKRFAGYLSSRTNIKAIEFDTTTWKKFQYNEIFDIKKGYYNKKPPTTENRNAIPFIGATEKQNGITSYVSLDSLQKYSRDGTDKTDEAIENKLFPAKCITISNNGSVGEAFYQPKPFTCSHDINPIYLKDKSVELTPQIALFLVTIIKMEKYRWGYARKWRPIRMPNSQIFLPAKANGNPDWEYMEKYVEQLPYADKI